MFVGKYLFLKNIPKYTSNNFFSRLYTHNKRHSGTISVKIDRIGKLLLIK